MHWYLGLVVKYLIKECKLRRWEEEEDDEEEEEEGLFSCIDIYRYLRVDSESSEQNINL